MSSTSGRNAKNNDENEVDDEDENGHTVDKYVSGTPVVLNTILTSLWHLWKYIFLLKYELFIFIVCYIML